MLKIAICDDNLNYCHTIDCMIKKFSSKNLMDVKVDIYNSGFYLVENYERKKYDLLLLDISMPKMDGFETAEKIKRLDSSITIVFCTSHYDFPNAQKGLYVEANNFLKKPISEKKMEIILKKINSKKIINAEEKFVLKNQEGIITIQISDIIFMEVQRKAVIIHGCNKKIVSYLKLHEFEEILGDKNFHRCHNSYLINLDYIESIQNNCVILRGREEEKIPISKYKRKSLLMKIAEYASRKAD